MNQGRHYPRGLCDCYNNYNVHVGEYNNMLLRYNTDILYKTTRQPTVDYVRHKFGGRSMLKGANAIGHATEYSENV